MARATALPVTPARIVSLEARGPRLVFETRPPALIDGELPGEAAALHVLDTTTGADAVHLPGLDEHALSADGQRTWGGVQGIKGPWPLMDGTVITVPKDSLASTDGRCSSRTWVRRAKRSCGPRCRPDGRFSRRAAPR